MSQCNGKCREDFIKELETLNPRLTRIEETKTLRDIYADEAIKARENKENNGKR